MILSRRETTALARVFALLAEDLGEREVRLGVGRALLELLQADQFASYVWDAAGGRFVDGVWLHMEPANLARYERWYQFRDPITFALQARRHATAVSEVMPHAELARTEFFNDFLARDGLHWGMNLHAFDGAQALGDLRIWRARHRKEFDNRDKMLLDMIEPAFVAALRRARSKAALQVQPLPAQMLTQVPTQLLARGPTPRSAVPLSPREMDVARCVCQGLTDKEIARALNIALPSVRTYLSRVFEKLGVHRRAGLAQLSSRFH